MAMVINSNIMSLNAQRNLTTAQNEQNQAMERLTSGKRINSAADDAAGLAISNRMTSQISGLNQAVRNSNDGISMIQTAEGALEETGNILQRMRELAVQSANGTYDSGNRSTLNAEVEQLQAELDRISETTSFNGQNVLDGTLGDVSLQVGADANQTIDFTIGAMDASSLGSAAGGDLVGAQMGNNLAALQVIDGTAEAMSINGQDVGDLSGAANLSEVLDTINSNVSGVEVSAFTELTAANDGTGIIRGTDVLEITLVGPGAENNTLQVTDTGSMEELVDKINEQGAGQIEASLNDDGRLVLASATGAQITVTDNAGGDASGMTTTANVTQNAQLSFEITDSNVTNVDIAYSGTANTNTGPTAAQIQAIGVQARTDSDITGSAVTDGAGQLAEDELVINGVSIGAGAANTVQATIDAINAKSAETGVVASGSTTNPIVLNSVDGTEISIEAGDAGTAASVLTKTGLLETNSADTVGNSVADIDISTAAGAQKAIGILDKAIEQVSSTRGDLGAVNNRLDFTINNLSSISENVSASRSRIMDADFAAESANLSRAQVLQQAGSAMLAQANAAPQQVLSLLQ